MECQVKLRVPPQTPFLTNQFFIFLLGGNEEPRRDPSVYGFSCHYLVRSSRSALVMMMTALFAHIRRCVALFTPVVIWHQGVGLILAGWHYAAVTDKKKKKAAVCGDTTGPVSVFSTAALFIVLCPIPFDFSSSFRHS